MTIKDINDIIKAVCPNDEDYDKPIISPKYLRQELEQLALEQEHKHIEPTTKNDFAVDCISRKAALDITWHDPSYSDPLNVLTEVRDKIRELPSVTPQEPRKGKWISKPHMYGVTYCSECDFELKIDDTNYCPNCGAKMEKRIEEVVEDGND